MGDRGNIVVRSLHGDDVWLYSHWGGTELKDVLKTVLARKERWDDAPYIARMIFSKMIEGCETEATGFGISTYMCDNEHGILVVDVPNQKVVRMEETALVGLPRQFLPDQLDYRVSRTFEEFAENGFKGKKKRVERRIDLFTNRRKMQPHTYPEVDRRKFSGRRKDD